MMFLVDYYIENGGLVVQEALIVSTKLPPFLSSPVGKTWKNPHVPSQILRFGVLNRAASPIHKAFVVCIPKFGC